MSRKTIKKGLPILIGGLILAMVVSILPLDILAEASKGIRSVKENKLAFNKVETKTNSIKYLDLHEAEEIALKKVNDKEAVITDYEVELTYFNPHYDFEIWTKDYKYEIEVHGITGEIKEFEKEKIKEVIKEEIIKNEVVKEEIKEKKIRTNNGRFISKDEAKIAALEEINDKTARLTGFEMELEKDIPHYLIEVKTSTHEYLMKIDAETGDVYDIIKELDNDGDDDDDDDDHDDYKIRGNSDKINKENKGNKHNNGNKNKDMKNKNVVNVKYITEAKAIEIALGKIGTKAKLDEIKFDKDDNPSKYEIEMYDMNYEYEIEIHAITGAILKFERD